MSTERIIVKLMKYNPNSTSKEVLHQLIKRIINPSYSIDNNLLKSTDWPSVKKEAAKQGVLAFIFDAITTLPKDLHVIKLSLSKPPTNRRY